LTPPKGREGTHEEKREGKGSETVDLCFRAAGRREARALRGLTSCSLNLRRLAFTGPPPRNSCSSSEMIVQDSLEDGR
jgi:hypothetical protein